MQVLVLAAESAPPSRLLALLEQRGHRVEDASEPLAVLPGLRRRSWDLLVVALEALGPQAASLCAQLSAARADAQPPLLVWSERVEPPHLELLLSAGADDYLLATMTDGELTARMIVAEHRAQTAQQKTRPETCHGPTPFACCPLLQDMPYGVFRSTAEGHFLEVNQTLVRLLGYANKEELLTIDLNRDLYCDPQVRRQLLAVNRDYVDGVELAWKRKDGTPVSLHVAGRILRDDQGHIVLLEGIAEDVTPRKEAEAAARDQMERNRLLLESSLESFMICDLAGRVLEVNPPFCTLSGYSRHELLAMSVVELDSQMTAEEVFRTIQEIARRGSGHFSTRMRQKQGGNVDLEINARIGCFGEQELLFLFIRDTTPQREAAARLQESEDRYRLIAENVTDAIWTAEFGEAAQLPEPLGVTESRAIARRVMEQWQFVFFSPSIQRVLGYRPEEALALRLSDVLTPATFEAAAERLAEQLRLEQLPSSDPSRQITLEIEHITKQGAKRWAEITVTFLRNTQGQLHSMLGVTRDITQRRQAEAAIQQEQERLRQLLELHERDRKVLAMELHDELAQQLTGAMMTLEAAWQLRHTTPEQAGEHFRRGTDLLRQGIEHSRRLVGGLRPPSLDEFGLVPAIEHLISQHQAPDGPEIQFVSKGHWQRLAQPLESAIFRIVQETLTNALRHSHSKRVQVELACRDSHIWITVQDWGIGFDADLLGDDSPGLGGVRERARLFGGRVLLRTAPGRGTRLRVRLPLVPLST